MQDLALYLTMAVVGYVIGGKFKDAETIQKWTGRLQTLAIILLIFTMGMRMGSNEQVVANLNFIGLYAVIMTIVIMFTSVLTMMVVRKAMGLDRKGRFCREANAGENDSTMITSDEPADHHMTVLIILCVAGGLAFGHFAVGQLFDDMLQFERLAGKMITIGLCTMLFFVGFDMGVDGTVIENFRKVGIRVFAFPFAVMGGTLIGAFICALFLPISIREGLAIGGGFGWYTFAPGLIMEAGLVTASAICFMHNILREFLSLLVIPIVAEKVGYLESTALPACSCMDVCLPIIEKSTRSDIAMYSFVSGVIQSMAVPIVVPLILG